MNWHESAKDASAAQREQFAPGIEKAQKYLDGLAKKGEIPERFTPDRPMLHPFLEGKVAQESLTIGGRTASELLQTMTQRGVRVGSYARSMIESLAFTTLAEPTQIDLALVPARVLVPGKDFPTTREIFQRADELGLDKVPSEVGPNYRLAHMDQLRGEWVAMGMEPVTGSGGGPRVFEVGHDDDGLWLYGRWTYPDYEWSPGHEFVFSLRK